MIPAFDTLHVLARPLYHARALMPQHHGTVGLGPAVTEIYIGMADARGDEAHQDFILPRAFHPEGFDLQGATLRAQDGRLNRVYFYAGTMIHRSATNFIGIIGSNHSSNSKIICKLAHRAIHESPLHAPQPIWRRSNTNALNTLT